LAFIANHFISPIMPAVDRVGRRFLSVEGTRFSASMIYGSGCGRAL